MPSMATPLGLLKKDGLPANAITVAIVRVC
jgi:hypothetical protein